MSLRGRGKKEAEAFLAENPAKKVADQVFKTILEWRKTHYKDLRSWVLVMSQVDLLMLCEHMGVPKPRKDSQVFVFGVPVKVLPYMYPGEMHVELEKKEVKEMKYAICRRPGEGFEWIYIAEFAVKPGDMVYAPFGWNDSNPVVMEVLRVGTKRDEISDYRGGIKVLRGKVTPREQVLLSNVESAKLHVEEAKRALTDAQAKLLQHRNPKRACACGYDDCPCCNRY